MPSRRSVLGIAGISAASSVAGCLGSIRERVPSDSPVMLGEVVFINTSEIDRTGDLIVIWDDEIDHWRSFTVDGMDGQTVRSEQIPETELGEPVTKYQVGIAVEDIDMKWFNLADTVPEATIERCQRRQNSLSLEMDIRSNEWIGATFSCA